MHELLSQREPFSEFDSTFKGKPPSYFVKALLEGLRPTIPLIHKFSKGFVELIEKSWDSNPTKRPDFFKISEILSEICGVKISNEEYKKFQQKDDLNEDIIEQKFSEEMSGFNRTLLNHFVTKFNPKIGSIENIFPVIPGEEVWIGKKNIFLFFIFYFFLLYFHFSLFIFIFHFSLFIFYFYFFFFCFSFSFFIFLIFYFLFF